MISIPTDRQIWESEIATFWWEEEILVSFSKPVMRTVENITANVNLVKQITNDQPAPLLIYLVASPIPDKATRKFSAEKVPEIYCAMAMISKQRLSQFIMKMVFALKPAPIPTKQFSTKEAAVNWLKSL